MAKKKKLDYDEVARNIISNVGGKENVNSLRHCITRVRFRLKDESLANDEVLKNTEGVISIVKGGGEYMVVIGNQVSEVYDAICAQLEMADGVNTSADMAADTGRKTNPVMRVLNIIMGAVNPALNMICAGGVLKGILAILGMMGMATDSSMYILLNAMGDAVFYFLPVILGFNMAKSLGGDGFLGLVIGTILVYPSINGVDLQLFGMTINATYTSSFLPVILITAVAVPISKVLKKYIPKAVSGFAVPVITLLLVMPVGFGLIGPASSALGNGVNAAITGLMGVAPVVGGVVFAGLYQIMVLFGIHGALTSFSFMNVLSGNPDPIMALSCYCCFAQIGVVGAMYLKSKNENLKSVALPAFISGLFGVTEPAIYGVTLPQVRMFVISCIGAAIGGAYVMATGIVMHSFTGLGIVTILGMVSPENPDFFNAVMSAVVPFVASFLMAFVLYKEEKTNEKETKTVIKAPVPGNVVSLEKVPDETFSSGMLGHGFAIEPSEGKVFAPFDGTCDMVFDTLHAMGLTSDTGVSILIHVGLETVGLEGKPFKAHVKNGEKITKGQLLLEFDMEQIKAAGLSTITPVLVTNEDEVGEPVIENETMVIGG